jgi:hypothetical protein
LLNIFISRKIKRIKEMIKKKENANGLKDEIKNRGGRV